MKPGYSSILRAILLVTLPTLTAWIGQASDGQTAEYNNQKDFNTYSESFEIVKKVFDQLARPDDMKLELQNEEDARNAVDRGLQVFLRLLKDKPEQASDLGFTLKQKPKTEDLEDTIAEAKQALNNAFPVFEIHLDTLQGYSPATSTERLLLFTNQLLLPISAEKHGAKSSLTIRLTLNKQEKGKNNRPEITWTPTRWGQKNLIRILTAEQDMDPVTRKPGFLVSIPSLNRNFLGYKESKTIKFVPLDDDRLLDLKRGESLLAEKVLEKLATEARRVDERPR